jgi:uncharacterized protein involved in exopolysaccharide biosynthesis
MKRSAHRDAERRRPTPPRRAINWVAGAAAGVGAGVIATVVQVALW